MKDDQLFDSSLMPYGKHKGKEMQDVPASYLMWLHDNDRANTQVAAYIRENYDVLMKELEQEDMYKNFGAE